MAENKVVKYKMLAIGGSAGSLDVIFKIITALSNADNLSVIIIVHRKNDGHSILVSLLSSRTNLSVREVEDKEPITAGTIFIAPADYHVLIENEAMFCLD